MLGAKLIIKPKKGGLRERSPSYADFLPSILMVTGLLTSMMTFWGKNKLKMGFSNLNVGNQSWVVPKVKHQM